MALGKFQKTLQEKNIDVVFLTHLDSNLTYFTQIKPSFAYLTITPKTATFYLTSLDVLPKLKGITSEILKKGWEKKITSSKVKKVGINKELLSVNLFEKFRKLFPKAKFIDVSKELKQLRSQKLPEEVKKIQKACSITTNAFNNLLEELPSKKLTTEQDVAFFLEREMRSQNTTLAFPSIVAMGKNAATPHHLTSSQKLRKGFLLLDFGACYQNYCSDMSRVVFLGTPNKSEKKFYNLLSLAQEAAIYEIKENKPFFELDKCTRKNLGQYSSNFIHSLGHGVGIDVHEQPSFSPELKHTIQKNQVFTIEPGIYFPNKFGLRIEDTLVFDGKSTILTTAPKKLLKIRN